MTDHRIPVVLLTGFLGSGKTTILNAWLQSDELSRAAVVVNEFGEIGVDHTLIRSSSDQTIELTTGCLCCTVKGDLVNTLQDLLHRRETQEIRAFDRVVIETTGLADPIPAIHSLVTAPLGRHFRLEKVVTAVDAVNGLETLGRHTEALKQTTVADAIMLTKVDLARDATNRLIERLRALNSDAPVYRSSPTTIPSVGELIRPQTTPGAEFADISRWQNTQAYSETDEIPPEAPEHTSHHHHDRNRHNGEISSYCLEFSEPLLWKDVGAWFNSLAESCGSDLLRVKGILNVVDRNRPVAVHVVQHLLYPPTELDRWPDDQRKSQIVFITRRIPREYVCAIFEAIRKAH